MCAKKATTDVSLQHTSSIRSDTAMKRETHGGQAVEAMHRQSAGAQAQDASVCPLQALPDVGASATMIHIYHIMYCTIARGGLAMQGPTVFKL